MTFQLFLKNAYKIFYSYEFCKMVLFVQVHCMYKMFVLLALKYNRFFFSKISMYQNTNENKKLFYKRKVFDKFNKMKEM